MKVCLGSAFRNSSSRYHLERYQLQMQDLRYELLSRGDELFFIAAEGDSSDNTRERLYAMLRERNGVLVDVTHGQREFGSTEEPERFRALQGVGNGIMQSVPQDADVLVYVESDLQWDARTIMALIARLSDTVDIVSPLIFAGDCFYDVFAYRADGQRFSPFPPYSHALNDRTLAEVDSTGSCLVMKARVARECRLPDHNGLVGFCDEARSKHYHVYVDATQRIRHL